MANKTVRNPAHNSHVREKIQTSVLVHRLHKNATADQEFMTANQIRSAEILLKKSLPDLSTVTHEGNDEKPLVGIIKRVIVRPSDTNG